MDHFMAALTLRKHNTKIRSIFSSPDFDSITSILCRRKLT